MSGAAQRGTTRQHNGRGLTDALYRAKLPGRLLLWTAAAAAALDAFALQERVAKVGWVR